MWGVRTGPAAGSVSGAPIGPAGSVSGAPIGPAGSVSGAPIGPAGSVSGAPIGPAGSVSGAPIGPAGSVSGAPISPVPDVFRDARRHPEMLRLLGRYALAHRPPTGFLRDFVVLASGRHRGRLDLKRGGLVPIVDLARWAGMAAGVTSASTPARLRAAAAAGTLAPAAAATLEEAFHLVLQLRLAHQVEQLRAGAPPDDLVRPRDLSTVTRAALKEAFRAVASVQRRIAAELDQGVR